MPRIACLTTHINTTDGNVPDAIQLLPAGAFRALDGRPADVAAWSLNAKGAAALVAQVAARKTPIVIDYEHQTLNAAKNGQPAPASGWFGSVEWREGSGLWATGVDWTERARTMIASGEYKFISPVFIYGKDGSVLRLLHAALTNDPALDGMSAVAALAFDSTLDLDPESDPETPMNPEMLKLLGLAETATEAEALEALKALVAKMAEAETGMADLKSKSVPLTAVQDLQGQVAALTANAQAREVDDLIKPALADGRLLSAMEPWARDLGKSNLAALKQFVDNAQPIAALNGTQSGGQPPANGGNGLSAEQMAVCTQLGLTAEEFIKAKLEG